MEKITINTGIFEKTVDINKIIGARVLTKKGFVVGKVKDVRIDQKAMNFEGIVVGGAKKAFFGVDYIEKLNYEAIILNIDPSYLIKGERVIDTYGKILGKVKEVNREAETNTIANIIVKPSFRKAFVVPKSRIKSIGSSVVIEYESNNS